jgi:hypothetical protein
MWNGTMARRRAGMTKKMNVIVERTHPSFWEADKSENAKLKGELAACEKEKRSLNDLVRHIGQTIVRHVTGKA